MINKMRVTMVAVIQTFTNTLLISSIMEISTESLCLCQSTNTQFISIELYLQKSSISYTRDMRCTYIKKTDLLNN